ncbi:MAG: hypothetical protein IT514_02140 [Burkholderiales bacterium]|nr:hypothetical protein [Burkholderiales bacterium]
MSGMSMQRSEGRTPTTHAGSLIRPPDPMALMRANERGRPRSHADFQARLASGQLSPRAGARAAGRR